MTHDDTLGIIAGRTGPATQIVPGHGVVSTREDVAARVSELVSQEMTYEQVAAANPTAAYEAKWGSPDRFLTAVYEELNGGTSGRFVFPTRLLPNVSWLIVHLRLVVPPIVPDHPVSCQPSAERPQPPEQEVVGGPQLGQLDQVAVAILDEEEPLAAVG